MSLHKDQYKCSVCAFALWHPISRLGVSFLGLYDDARFPGRCLLVLDQHAEDLSSLDPKVAQAFLTDVQKCARAIMTTTKAPRMNYAVLGNLEPHLHFHLIPRGQPDDPLPTRPPWEPTIKKSHLPASEIKSLIERISAELRTN